MPDGQLLEFSGVTKRFGAITAVSGLTARVEPGRVTGFLGPNGAGKTTTLRILLGLVRATEGRATIGGKHYAELDKPLRSVGAVLEASSFHPGRTAAAHLTIYAQAAGIARSRVGEVLDLVGLTGAANRKVGGFSLGMRQRLGLAYALLGDPGVLVLDEPANGLDPEGIRWMRGFLRRLAGEGRTVLVSSHLLAEVQQTVDALLIISGGRLVFQGSIEELTDPDESATVVDAPDRGALTAALQRAGVPFEVLRSGLTVRGLDPAAVGAAAAAGGVALSSLHRRGPALEEVFLDLVNGTRVHASATGALSGLSQVPGTDAAPAAVPTAGAATVAGVAAAGAAEAAAASPGDGEGVAEAPVASPESAEAESAEAEESALTAAELDAGATGAPGAASALGAAAGAAWATESRQADESADAEAATAAAPDAPDAREARSAEDAGAAQEAAAAENAASADEPAADAAPSAATAAPVSYAVAGTGVIDIVPAAGRTADAGTEATDVPAAGSADAEADAAVAEDARDDADAAGPAVTQDSPGSGEQQAAEAPAPADPWAPEDANPDVEALGAIDEELSAPEPPEAPDAPAAAPQADVDVHGEPEGSAPDPWTPQDADPDVEALGTIDDELSTPEPPDADDDRPWEHYVKTDSDLEADAFFAAFDAHGNPHPEPGAAAEPGAGPASDSTPERGSNAGREADPDSDADSNTNPEPDSHSEPDPEAWVPPEAAAFEDAVDARAETTTPEGAPDDTAESPAAAQHEASVPPSDGDADSGGGDEPERGDQEGGDR